jgi:hypothetical protein
MSNKAGVLVVSHCIGLAIMAQAALAFAQDEATEASTPAAEATAAEATPAPAPVAVAAPTSSEDKETDRFAMGIYFNPLSILFGFYGLELDFSPQHFYSINVSGTYYSRDLLGVKTSAYGGDIGVQMFLTGSKPLHGAYIYPRIAYANAKAEVDTTSLGGTKSGAEANLIGIGVTAGYQWNWQPFSLRLGGGIIDYLGSAKATGDSSGSVPEISMQGVLPALDFTLGFVF